MPATDPLMARAMLSLALDTDKNVKQMFLILCAPPLCVAPAGVGKDTWFNALFPSNKYLNMKSRSLHSDGLCLCVV